MLLKNMVWKKLVLQKHGLQKHGVKKHGVKKHGLRQNIFFKKYGLKIAILKNKHFASSLGLTFNLVCFQVGFSKDSVHTYG